ncbi:glycerol-3-phosphate ABC transporter [Lactobacillus psittaci DSM 15354]|uniref:Glycerol-3-phosphate ABC transporter n=5 Tax=Lactobacillus psittaci TaxID=116089 RepID=A0A0R1RXT8_9LACO|nr:glycerol-3-phosphate ABC transporter [Lactobacillus psittaci DSM 15354]
MFSKASAMQKAAAFKYIKFLVSKSSQLTWANKTGYVPVNTKVVNSAAYKNSGLKTPAIIADAMKKLYSVPVAKNSNAAYSQLNSIMQTILASAAKKQNVNSQITAGKAKFDAAWKQ